MKANMMSRARSTRQPLKLIFSSIALALLGACARPGPLGDADIMAFAATNDAAKAQAFYVDTLGLRFIEDDDYALVVESAGTRIRVQKAKGYQPPAFTVLGWRVQDIEACATRLSKAGVKLERFEWMAMQDERCIATFSNGDKVAWFKDPDGNTLSIAQLVR